MRSILSKLLGLLLALNAVLWLFVLVSDDFVPNQVKIKRDELDLSAMLYAQIALPILRDNSLSEFEKKISYGVVASDVALKLGLLGTIIGFILMLKPIADLNSTSPEDLKIALSSMSSGMAVALYTTLTGLIVSTLLRIQFHFSATWIISLLNDLAFYTENNFE